VRHERWGPRLIDIDLLLCDQYVLRQDELELPHPRMIARPFVLQPAAAVGADMIHPTTGWAVGTLWEHLRTASRYVPLAGAPCSGRTSIAKTLARRPQIQAILEQPNPLELNCQVEPQQVPELLRQVEQGMTPDRRARLTRVSAVLAEHPDIFVISDFWPSQPPLRCSTWYDERSKQTRQSQQPAGVSGLPMPKIVVLLDFPSRTIIERIAACVVDAMDNEARARISVCIESYCRALRRLARTPGHGPILCVSGESMPVISEIQAAIAAMDSV